MTGHIGEEREELQVVVVSQGGVGGIHQQPPPQLFPQLAPTDAQWPLNAATPQRENWSRHKSATDRRVPGQNTEAGSKKNNIKSSGLTSKQLFMCTHGPHTHFLVDDVHTPQTAK